MVREPVELIHAQVQALRECGVHRFGVNLILTATDPELLEAQVAVCVALGVPVVGLFWNLSAPLVQRLRAIADEAEACSRPGPRRRNPCKRPRRPASRRRRTIATWATRAGRNC